jgi:hypothetical protein
MKRQNLPMEKEIVSLMCESIKKQNIDVDEMALSNTEKAIEFIHGQYRLAESLFKKKSRCAQLQ